MSDRNVRLQNLRDFTVQIRRLDNNQIVGTGVVVSMDGQVVTCEHVVRAAGAPFPKRTGGEVGIYFPQARGGEAKARRATVAACFPQHDDDVVLLQLADGSAPLGPEQIAVLGVEAARRAVAPDLGVAWNNAPPPLPEVGRHDLLAAITADWADPARHVTGLIGFGGEGKSSLAR